MPYAVTHILVAVLLIELFRKYFVQDKKNFPRYYILIAAIGGIIPDFDILAYYLLSFFGFTFEQIHRTFLHTIFIPLILFLIGIITLKFSIKNSKTGKRHMKIPVIFFILASGTTIHLLLDMLIDPLILFYPLSNFAVGIETLSHLPEKLNLLVPPSVDGALLLLWLFWMEFKLKITDYF